MPAAIEPMKAQIAERLPRGDDWLFEVKWDGVRAIALIENESLRLQSRTGIRCERQYPELAVIPHQVAARDGRARWRNRRARCQGRLAVSPDSAAHHECRSQFHRAHGALHPGGLFRLRSALPRMDTICAACVSTSAANSSSRWSRPDAVFRISDAFPGAGEEMLEAARENGLEGLIAKHAASCYESKRSREWLKIKIVDATGICHRRIHRAAGRPLPFRRAGAGRLRGRQVELGGQRRHGLRPENCST